MLTAIIAVTLAAPDLDAVEKAYVGAFGYRVVERGRVPAALAAAWSARAASGRRFLLLQTSSAAPVYLRVIESPPTSGYALMKSQGWSSNEILVEDVDAVARHLEGSAFRVVGAPHSISTNPQIRAMQVIGPAGELVYLTRPEGSLYIRTRAQAFIDRTFIVVLGGPDMGAMRAFYRDRLKLEVTDPMPAQILVLNEALGRPAATSSPLALARVSPAFAIELDEYPSATPARPQRPDDLPPGMAMVTFAATALDSLDLPWVVAPAVRAEAPYAGARAGLVRGAAGELIELVARGG